MPSKNPTKRPTIRPTKAPTRLPTIKPSKEPTKNNNPSRTPTKLPNQKQIAPTPFVYHRINDINTLGVLEVNVALGNPLKCLAGGPRWSWQSPVPNSLHLPTSPLPCRA